MYYDERLRNTRGNRTVYHSIIYRSFCYPRVWLYRRLFEQSTIGENVVVREAEDRRNIDANEWVEVWEADAKILTIKIATEGFCEVQDDLGHEQKSLSWKWSSRFYHRNWAFECVYVRVEVYGVERQAHWHVRLSTNDRIKLLFLETPNIRKVKRNVLNELSRQGLRIVKSSSQAITICLEVRRDGHNARRTRQKQAEDVETCAKWSGGSESVNTTWTARRVTRDQEKPGWALRGVQERDQCEMRDDSWKHRWGLSLIETREVLVINGNNWSDCHSWKHSKWSSLTEALEVSIIHEDKPKGLCMRAEKCDAWGQREVNHSDWIMIYCYTRRKTWSM